MSRRWSRNAPKRHSQTQTTEAGTLCGFMRGSCTASRDSSSNMDDVLLRSNGEEQLLFEKVRNDKRRGCSDCADASTSGSLSRYLHTKTCLQHAVIKKKASSSVRTEDRAKVESEKANLLSAQNFHRFQSSSFVSSSSPAGRMSKTDSNVCASSPRKQE